MLYSGAASKIRSGKLAEIIRPPRLKRVDLS
jgi:hypothetical protein